MCNFSNTACCTLCVIFQTQCAVHYVSLSHTVCCRLCVMVKHSVLYTMCHCNTLCCTLSMSLSNTVCCTLCVIVTHSVLYTMYHCQTPGAVDCVSLSHTVCCLISLLNNTLGRLRGLTVACWTTDHNHPCSNPGVGISEGCFVFHFVSLPLDVARPI